MNIKETRIKAGEIFENFSDSGEKGITGYNGKLNIRPPYQREFIYGDKEQKEVIRTVMRGYPLNTMYWAKTDDGYELLDGQQRTLSLMKYIHGDFSVNEQYFHSLTKKEQEDILNYPLLIYIVTGDDREKLEWFKIVNIAGKELSDQEIRNSVYTGTWLTDAKKYFSKTGGAAYKLGNDFVKAIPIRQEYLEEALKWITDKENITIEEYMSLHQYDHDSEELETFYETVIKWAKKLFPQKGNFKKGLNWGRLYNQYGNNEYDPKDFETKIKDLLDDEEVTKKSGIPEYLLSGDERYLNLRSFSKKDKEIGYEKAGHKCQNCGRELTFEEAQADHIIPWSRGGKTELSNLQILCRDCNLKKG